MIWKVLRFMMVMALIILWVFYVYENEPPAQVGLTVDSKP